MNIDVESTRKNLLLALKESAHKLTPYLHEASSGVMFDEKNSHAQNLCSAIEKCIFHGIKITEFCGVMPFWGLLERLETTTPPLYEVRNSVGAVACMQLLRTPVGRSRGWIRQALNGYTLEATITALTKYHQRLLLFFYEEDALLNTPGDVAVLLAILRSLKVFKFSFTVDSSQLNYNPDWLTQQFFEQQQRTTRQATRRRGSGTSGGASTAAPSNAQTGTGSSLFGGMGLGDLNLLSSLEKGVDTFINQAVKYLNESIVGDDAGPVYTSSNRPPHVSSLPPSSYNDSTGYHRGRYMPLFGTSLKALLLDETRCSVARLDPLIGVPNMLMLLVNAISAAAFTEGLFRHRGPAAETQRLRASLEAENGIPPETSVHSLTHCFLQWMYELPEPLLGFEVYDAMQSCQDIESEEHRNRNLTLLVEEVPWYCQPTLAMVMKLLYDITRPDATEANGLNIVAVAVFATPFLLRHPKIAHLHGPNMSPEDVDNAHMTAAAAGGAVVGILVDNMPDAFGLLMRTQKARAIALTRKCERLRAVQREALRPILLKAEDVTAGKSTGTDEVIVEDDEAVLAKIFGTPCDFSDFTESRESVIYDLLSTLWKELRPTHHRLTTKDSQEAEADGAINKRTDLDDVDELNEMADISPPTEVPLSPIRPGLRRAASFAETSLGQFYAREGSSTRDIGQDDGSLPASPSRLAKLAKSSRWSVCFPLENPLKEFNSQLSGLLAIKCLTYFLQKFGDKASLIVCEFARKRKNLAPLPMVCAYLVQICLVGLKLVNAQSFSYTASSKRNKRRSQRDHPSDQDLNEDCISLRLVAREPLWRFLSEESCLEELFCVSLLTFDDLWKHLLPSGSSTPPPPLTSSPVETSETNEKTNALSSPTKTASTSALAKEVLASCMTGCRVLIDELLGIGPVVVVDQMWRIWSEQRLQRQQAVVEAQFKRRKQMQAQVVQKQPTQSDGDTNSSSTSSGSSSGSGVRLNTDKYIPNHRPEPHSAIKPIAMAAPAPVPTPQDPPTGTAPHDPIEDTFTYAALPGIEKFCLGIPSRVYGDKELIILTKDELQMLEDALPMDMQCCDWDLTYSLLRDGASLETLLRATGKSQRTVLVIEDSGGRKFGGVVCDDAWRMEGERYYGSGTCMVFTFQPKDIAANGVELKMYSASLRNEYYMLMSHTCIGMGGGGGGFAFMLDGDLQYGSSSKNCETFDSPCLASAEEFECYRCNLFVVHRV